MKLLVAQAGSPTIDACVQRTWARVLIWMLSLCAIASSVWIVTHLSDIPAPQPFAPATTVVFFFSDQMLASVSGLFPVAIWSYAIAVILASALAMMVTARPAQIHAALFLGAALSGFSFFTVQFLFVHRIPLLAATPLPAIGDYLGMVAFGFGSWAAMQVAFSYPQLIDTEAYIAFVRKQRSVSRENSPWQKMHQWLYARSRLERIDARTELAANSFLRFQLNAVRSRRWPWITGLLGCCLVCFFQIFGPAKWIFMPAFLVLGFPSFVMAVLFIGVLNWQYRTGRQEDKARITWLVLGLVVAGWLTLIPQLGACVWSVFGGGESPGQVMSINTCLELPMLATVMVILLGCSIFFFGAIDPRLAIRKTSVYGVAALLLAVALAVLQGTAASHLVQRFGLPGNSGLVLAAAVVGLVFAPLRSRIEGRVERLVERVLPASTLAEAERETVTVVFGDMSGYTELSARDETNALTLASLLHKESRRLAERHGGRLVKSIGDAVLLSFRDAGEAAVACQELRDKFSVATDTLNLPSLPLHFGVHLGEVVRDHEGDIFGGTVNLAARLQGLAAAGEIVVSAAVAEVLNPVEFKLKSLGEKKLKNVPVPVACFRLT